MSRTRNEPHFSTATFEKKWWLMEGLHLRNTLWPIDQTTAIIAAAAATDAATMTTDSQIYLILPSIHPGKSQG